MNKKSTYCEDCRYKSYYSEFYNFEPPDDACLQGVELICCPQCDSENIIVNNWDLE